MLGQAAGSLLFGAAAAAVAVRVAARLGRGNAVPASAGPTPRTLVERVSD
jgi:hypothetical protein